MAAHDWRRGNLFRRPKPLLFGALLHHCIWRCRGRRLSTDEHQFRPLPPPEGKVRKERKAFLTDHLRADLAQWIGEMGLSNGSAATSRFGRVENSPRVA
ncbi:MAG: hypothetical protein IPP23_10080 [Sphingomonadales bacterium]|nr:hypothetical protein [Sphingomonadales bacterium]